MIDDVEKLIDIDKVTMCFTSPPYNLGDNAKLRGYNGDGKDSLTLQLPSFICLFPVMPGYLTHDLKNRLRALYAQ